MTDKKTLVLADRLLTEVTDLWNEVGELCTVTKSTNSEFQNRILTAVHQRLLQIQKDIRTFRATVQRSILDSYTEGT